MFQTQCLILPSAPLWEKWENLSFGESSYASSIFSDMETIFHTQDKPLLLLALFPLRCVLWLCVYSDYVLTLFHRGTMCKCEGIETFLFSCAVSCGFCVDPFQLGMPGILCM